MANRHPQMDTAEEGVCPVCQSTLEYPPDLGELRRRHRDVFCNAYVDRLQPRCRSCDEQDAHRAICKIESVVDELSREIDDRRRKMVSPEEDELLNAILEVELADLVEDLEKKKVGIPDLVREAWRKYYWAIWGKLPDQETM